jgi:putative hemolysin
MNNVILEILFIFFLAILNGVLAMSEIAIVSSRKVRLRQYAVGGDQRAVNALELAESPTKFLSTVQIGITLVGILAGALGGATIARILAEFFTGVPILEPYSEVLALTIVVLLVTYLNLVIGELVPKRFALNDAEKIALRVAAPMKRLSAITYPVVRFLSVSTDVVLRIMRVRPSSEPQVTEEEISMMMDEGAQEGVFEQVERDIVRRVFRFGDQRVNRLMTHRTSIEWLDVEEPEEEMLEIITSNVHSVFPVARGSLDDIIGMVLAKDILVQKLNDQPLDLKEILYPPLFIPERTPAYKVLERFIECQLPVALVIDEYGGLEGLITINDVLEPIIGDIPSMEEEQEEPEAVQRPDGSWLMDGMLPVDRLKEILNVKLLPNEAQSNFETVGGFIMAYLGRIPLAADYFEWNDHRFEVMDMDGRRVDKVMVSPQRQVSHKADSEGVQ